MRKPNHLLMLACLLGVLLLTTSGPAAGRPTGLPASAYVDGVVGYPQTYTLSCESRSAVDWARFFGASISESEFLNSLPRSDNPNAGFVGDPNGVWGYTPPASYGVHAGPVADLLRAYGVKARAHHGMSWKELRTEIADGRPVIVWVIGAMWDGIGYGYTAQDGETVRVAAFEHSMILVGYDEQWVYAVDASTGWTNAYSISAFQRSWEVLGNMAVTAPKPKKEPEQPTPPPTPTPVPATPAPTATPAAYAFLILEEPHTLYFPLVAQLHTTDVPPPADEDVTAAGVCLFTRNGVLQIRPINFFQGLCVSAALLRPEHLMGLAGGIPELP